MTFSYFEASYAFSAAISLCIVRAMLFTSSPGITATYASFSATDHLALDSVTRVLYFQSAAGNPAASAFLQHLNMLHSSLESLQATLSEAAMDAQTDRLSHAPV